MTRTVTRRSALSPSPGVQHLDRRAAKQGQGRHLSRGRGQGPAALISLQLLKNGEAAKRRRRYTGLYRRGRCRQGRRATAAACGGGRGPGRRRRLWRRFSAQSQPSKLAIDLASGANPQRQADGARTETLSPQSFQLHHRLFSPQIPHGRLHLKMCLNQILRPKAVISQNQHASWRTST